MSENLARVHDEYQEAGELLQRVNAVVSEPAMSQGKAAKEAGISPAALNQWLQGKYKGDNSEVESKLEKWLSARGRRIEVGKTLPDKKAYIATPTGERIKDGLRYGQASKDLLVITSPPGIGKTWAIRSHAVSAPNVWVVTMRPDTACVAACLEEIGEVTGFKAVGRSASKARELIVRMKNTGGLLVCDEAQHLTLAALDELRSIHDDAEMGLVLCGNESVYARLTGGNRSANFAQLFSRIGKRLRLTQPSKADVTALADAYGVTGKEERQALFEISQRPGALRAVVKTLNFAALMANSNGDTLNYQYISAAWKELGGEA
jgi:DNA transposition AAA+ family ATPase